MSTQDRRSYLTATTIDQDFLDNCADNLTCALEMVAEIELPDRTIYASDRNKYVGSRFYESLVKFPAINRTIGDWLQNELEFSTLTLELSNVDGRFNDLLPGGVNFAGLAGKSLTIKLGLRDVESTYRTIWKGSITEIGGIKRNIKTLSIIARDDYDRLNINIPTTVFDKNTYPDIEDAIEGSFIPFILGNWETNLINNAAIPGIVINGANPNVNGDTDHSISVGCWISSNTLTSFNINAVWLKRGGQQYNIDNRDILIGVNYNYFEITQNGHTKIDTDSYEFASGDEFFCQVSESTVGTNIVDQAKHMLKLFGGLSDSDFDANWTTYAAKAAPAESAIATFVSRVWVRDSQNLIAYVRSMLQQVRLELYITLDRKLKLFAMHYDEFVSSPSINVRNWDIEKDSFSLYLDDRNQTNRLNSAYNFEPIANENVRTSVFFRNDASISQLGKTISKQLTFPNLCVQSDVEYQTKEILKLTSSFFEYVEYSATWRLLLIDLGNFLSLTVDIGATVLENVPMLIRNISYDPQGIRIKVIGFSLQMFPYGMWNPGYNGIVSGANATITKE
jgi:hypothetical protein